MSKALGKERCELRASSPRLIPSTPPYAHTMIDWTHWHNEPYLVGGLVLLGWAYGLALGPLRDRIVPGAGFSGGRVICFYVGLLLFYLAVGSPLDQIGERFLFSAHMVQHQILIYPCAVLFLVGMPPWLVDRLIERLPWRGLGRFLTRPILAGLIYVLVQSAWHVPALYDLALQVRWVHVFEHVTFFGSALFFWWPLLSPSRHWPRIGYGGQMIYATLVMVAMTPLFA
ncbi:MAG TPA: cytochrome c oxidase assembly protein, partial [Candidatus Synoicihabitans sp.]|nr:cytochrome c oxidase assembly protein [Candidatus Synoicihabitans sp.]